MHICALQLNVILGKRRANMEAILRLVGEAMKKAPDVIALPETWDIGFHPEAAMAEADEEGREAREFLADLAQRHQVNIVGGSIVRKSKGALWNTCYVFDRQGREIAAFDKIHLFSPSGENTLFQPGNSLVRFTLDGVPATVIICYDLRFGELARMAALEKARILFAPAAWPHSRLQPWRLLATARAVENQFFVVAVNGCGHTGPMRLCGHSLVADPRGIILAEAGDEHGPLYAQCDFTVLEELRTHMNMFGDRRPDVYRIGLLQETTPWE